MARTDISYDNNANEANQFDRLGHPGKYTAVIKHTGGGQLDLTGSNYGFGGAMMIGSGSSTAFGATDKITLSGGGEIPLRDFGHRGSDVGELRNPILEVSVAKINTTEDCPDVYFFKRQQ
jgi:hypothetical protein